MKGPPQTVIQLHLTKTRLTTKNEVQIEYFIYYSDLADTLI